MSHLPDPLGWWFQLLDLMEWQSQLHGPLCGELCPLPPLKLCQVGLHSWGSTGWPWHPSRDFLTYWNKGNSAPHFKTNEAAQMVSESPSELIFPFLKKNSAYLPLICFMVYSCSILRSWTVFFHLQAPPPRHFVQNISLYSGIIPSLFLTSAEIADSIPESHLLSLCQVIIYYTLSIPFRISLLTLGCMRVKLLQSCPTLCNSMDCSPPGSSVHGIL